MCVCVCVRVRVRVQVRQIMKKWADLKCDARRRMLAMRAPKGHKKTLGPVEVMVQKILLLAPGKGELLLLSPLCSAPLCPSSLSFLLFLSLLLLDIAL